MHPQPFGSLPSGETVEAYTLANAAGASVQVLTYGGIVTSLRMPDRLGRLDDVVLGFDRLGPYLAGHPYFGAIVGRIAGRVSGGRLSVAGRDYALACNDRSNHLHGGHTGLDKRLWRANPAARRDGADSLRLTYRSPDGEEGYPGNIELAVTYTLTAACELIIDTVANADRSTPLSLAHHSYFNLAGEGSGSVAGHELQILAEACVPTDEAMTLSGRREALTGRPGDFTRPLRLGEAMPQLFQAHGDLYHLRAPFAMPPAAPTLAARVAEPQSGRVLEVSTDESCLQFYTGASLDGTLVGKSRRAYGPHAGLCLECQGYPDGASRPEFGDILLRPGVPQHRRTIYAFSTR